MTPWNSGRRWRICSSSTRWPEASATTLLDASRYAEPHRRAGRAGAADGRDAFRCCRRRLVANHRPPGGWSPLRQRQASPAPGSFLGGSGIARPRMAGTRSVERRFRTRDRPNPWGRGRRLQRIVVNIGPNLIRSAANSGVVRLRRAQVAHSDVPGAPGPKPNARRDRPIPGLRAHGGASGDFRRRHRRRAYRRALCADRQCSEPERRGLDPRDKALVRLIATVAVRRLGAVRRVMSQLLDKGLAAQCSASSNGCAIADSPRSCSWIRPTTPPSISPCRAAKSDPRRPVFSASTPSCVPAIRENRGVARPISIR